jgi:hypothetical protein
VSDPVFGFPQTLRSNAFTGDVAADGPLDAGARRWHSLNRPPQVVRKLGLVEDEIDLHKWQDPRVGWGVVARAPEGRSDADLANNADLPQSVRDLIETRNNAPVFRYRKGWDHEFDQLTNYRDNADVDIAGSEIGTVKGKLPKYLLILGGPDEVPWRLQFQLNSKRCVGRLPLIGADLDNYICHLQCGWKKSEAQIASPVVWATDFGYPDITELMHNVVAKPVYAAFSGNPRIGAKAVLLEGAAATRQNLTAALIKNCPAIVVSTSHGMIGPLDDPVQAAARLGALVDQNRQALDADQLVHDWSPDGAIWYAHACCSAGTQGGARFKGLVSTDSDLGKSLHLLSKIGPAIAPLPMRLLAAKHPARAFIGHVEPTFDWTLRNAQTGQLFTGPIRQTLYNQLLQPNSVGYAMQTLLGPLASINSSYINLMGDYKNTDAEAAQLLNYALRGLDLEATVLLGDPTAVLPDVK